MELSKRLRQDIMSVQSQLKNAIRDHAFCMIRLNSPGSTDDCREKIMQQMQEIQRHIMSLGKWQKDVIQQLRQEVQLYKSNQKNGAVLNSDADLGRLLGLGRWNVRGAELEEARRLGPSPCLVNGHANKDDYEDVVRNGNDSPPCEPVAKRFKKDDRCSKPAMEPAVTPKEELYDDTNQNNTDTTSISPEPEQQCFMKSLGLITNSELIAVKKKRAERKRRSNAGTNCFYLNWELPAKQKKQDYLVRSAPHTRQTTARLNGVSPPPFNNNNSTKASSRSSSSSSSSSKSVGKKPGKTKTVAILPKKNGEAKSNNQKTTRNSKQNPQNTNDTTVQIPRLPSGLTIERIENDSTVCIACRNPGSLMICDFCTSKFHVSCHTVSPASSNYCPMCAVRYRSDVLSNANLETLRHEIALKKEKEAAELYAQRAFGQPEEDPEFDKPSSGLRKTDTAGQTQRQQQLLNLGIKQLPSSTFLIPISTGVPGRDGSPLDEPIVPGTSSSHIFASSALSRLGYATLDKQQQQQSILLSQLSQSSLESRMLHHSYGEIVSPGQPLLVLDPVPEQPAEKRRWRKKKSVSKPKQAVSVLNYEWQAGRASTTSRSQQSEVKPGKSRGSRGGNYVTVEVICNNDDDYDNRKTPSENSNDCVYVSENSYSSGVPDVIDLESPPRSGEGKQPEEDFEVHNVSSGSSSSPAKSSKAAVPEQPVARDSASPAGSTGSGGNNTSVSSNFLGSIFPGKYGFKLEFIEVTSPAGRSSSASSSSASSMPADSPKQHVKLEETNEAASPQAIEPQEPVTAETNSTASD